jgi:hypothetical protein
VGALAFGLGGAWGNLAVAGDEGFELCKSYLLLTDPVAAGRMWNDQPWLHTMIMTAMFRVFGPHAGIPRLFTLFSVTGMFVALGWICRERGRAISVLAAIFFFTFQDNMVTLSVAGMCELVGFSWAIISTGAAFAAPGETSTRRLVFSGFLMAVAVHIKFTALIIMPSSVIFWIAEWGVYKTLSRLGYWLSGFVISFLTIAALSPAFNFDQLIGSHVGAALALNSEQKAEWTFHPELIWTNPAVLLAGVAGVFAARKTEVRSIVLFGLGLLGTAVIIACMVRPWWSYYIVHFCVPLSILAAVGTMAALRSPFARIKSWMSVETSGDPTGGAKTSAGGVLCAASIFALWTGFALPHLFNDISYLRQLRYQSRDSLLSALKEFQPRTRWCYTRCREYAFAAGLKIPPELVVLSIKRVVSGHLSEKGILVLAKQYQPEQVLLNEHEANNPEWRNWMTNQYVLCKRASERELWVAKRLQPPAYMEKEIRLERLNL